MNKYKHFFQSESGFWLENKILLPRQIALLLIVFLFGAGIVQSAKAELTKIQAISRVKTILQDNTAACQIEKINSVSAVRANAGWRVTAQILMSASGSPLSETAVWIVSEQNGETAQNQLTEEISNGCP